MDFLSPSQLHSYESIIDQIQSEYEKSQKLNQEIAKINNKLIISNLSKLKQSQKIGHVSVKIFSDIVELFNLYCDEINDDMSNLLKCTNCKFYLVEIFITKSLQKRLEDMVWALSLSVQNKSINVCKTVEIKQHKTPIILVVPVDKNIIDCTVSASLILYDENGCTYVSLDRIDIDISYHFEKYKKTKFLDQESKILEISKCHNPNLNILEIQKPLWVEYQFLTKIDSKEFIRLFIQHCYHNINLELFSELGNDSKNNFVIKFLTGSAKHSISFDRESKVISLKSNVFDLIRLKNYFCNEKTLEIKDEDVLKRSIKELVPLLNQCNGVQSRIHFKITASATITINEIIGPESVKIGSKDELILECDYEMEDEGDVVLMWFFNGLEEQIYQWIVGDDQAFALGSLKDLIDTNYSVPINNVKTFRALKFKEVSPALTGNYTCKVDGTNEFEYITKQVIVYSPASSFEMFIVGGNDEFPGDEFVLCDATNVSPKPNFDLYISEEDKMVVPNGTIIKKDTVDQEGSYNISITLHFNASYLDTGTTKFVCRLSIPGTNYTELRSMEYFVETEIEPSSPFENISEDYSGFNYTSNSTEEYLSEDEENGNSRLCSISLWMLLLTMSLVLAT